MTTSTFKGVTNVYRRHTNRKLRGAVSLQTVDESLIPHVYGLTTSWHYLLEDELEDTVKTLSKIRAGKHVFIGGMAVQQYHKKRVPTLDVDAVGDKRFIAGMVKRYGKPLADSGDAVSFSVNGVEVDVLRAEKFDAFKMALERRVKKRGYYIPDIVGLTLLKLFAINNVHRVHALNNKGAKDAIDILNLASSMDGAEQAELFKASRELSRDIKTDVEQIIAHVQDPTRSVSISIYEIPGRSVTEDEKVTLDRALSLVRSNKSIKVDGEWMTIVRASKGKGVLAIPAAWTGTKPTEKNAQVIPWDNLTKQLKSGRIQMTMAGLKRGETLTVKEATLRVRTKRRRA